MFDMTQFVERYASLAEIADWAQSVMDSRPPDFIIGGDYMERWFIIPRNAGPNVYLHRTLRSDDDRALHDHPWANSSLVLRGGYLEITPDNPLGVIRRPGDVVQRDATARHRLVLGPESSNVSLFFTGPKVRDWGFWCGSDGETFVPWQDFCNPHDRSAVGPGCGEFGEQSK